MGNPSKTTAVMTSERRVHRSKKVLDDRQKREKAFTTGEGLKEEPDVKSDPVAHRKFLEIKKQYAKIDLNNAIHSTSLNTFCKIYSECRELEAEQRQLKEDLHDWQLKYENDEISKDEYVTEKEKIKSMRTGNDITLTKKRDQMLKIEKESLMTVQSMLRAIPKKPPKSEEAADPMSELLNQRGYNFVRRDESG